jgi:UDP-galactopyranose mutase
MIPQFPPHFDFLVVGGGFAGLVTAERICNRLGKTCLLVDKRRHIGGNCYDNIDGHGVLLHKYGPHYFRTNSLEVKTYLDRFTKWRAANYVVKSYTDGRYWSFPINLNTFEELLGRPSTTEEFEAWLATKRVSIPTPANSEECVLSQAGVELYEKFFKGYTLKQWKKHPRDLDASVCGRIPLRTNRDDRYLMETFQAMPSDGYTRLFENLVDACGDLLRLELETDYHEVVARVKYDFLVYTGPIDDYFQHCYGQLPYRSLRFETESFTPNDLSRLNRPSADRGFWQPYLQVNYPNSEDFTRIVEIKHATGQDAPNTTVVREYPADYGPGTEPYYPVPTRANQDLYQQYQRLSQRESNTFFIGRLATYRYYNMDQVVAGALSCFEKQIVSAVGNVPQQERRQVREAA